jgi:ABC-2 type transport system permease protein
MRTIWLVIKHDAAATLRQVSFWILTLALPVLLLVSNGYRVIQENRPADTTAEDSADTGEPTEGPLPVGLVDEAVLITEIPEDIPADLWVSFPDQDSGRAALDAGDISQLIVLPADYMANGKVTVYDRDFSILRGGDEGVAFQGDMAWLLPYLLNYNFTGDWQLTHALGNPTPGHLARYHALQPPPETSSDDQALGEVVSTIMPYIFYGLLLLGSSWLLRCVAGEKENRTAELLLLSVRPRELMIGKILAMSVVLLVQIVAWVGGGLLMLSWGADVMQVARYQFPPGFLPLALLYLILGYLLFASLMAAGGAIAASTREAGPMTLVLVIPLMPTLMFGSAFLKNPHAPLPLVLSLIPFSAPSAMVTRLAVAQVPIWQVVVSLAGLALTTYGGVTLAARFFQSGNLLSSESFSFGRLARGWRKA